LRTSTPALRLLPAKFWIKPAPMADREPLDEDKLKSLLSAEIRAAVNYDSTELSSERALAIQYYDGVMSDTPSMAGRSRFVSKDVADTIGLMLPQVIRTFIASGRMVDYQPVGSEDDKFADLASDYINHLFMKENSGYRILWDSSHDSLLQGNGIIKHYWDSTPVCTYDVMAGKTTEELAVIMEDEQVEIVAQSEGEPVMLSQQDPATGQMTMVQVPTFDVKIKREDKTGRLCVECIEPENFLRNSGARFMEEVRFAAHKEIKTRSDLIEMGFDKDQVDLLPAYRTFNTTEEAQARNSFTVFNEVGDKSQDEIEVYECYVKVDVDGDGVSEMVRAYVAGNGGANEVLDWEEWEDDVPFSDIPCEPRPHRWDANSIFTETKDGQRVKTVLIRQMLDNLYASAIPMQEAEQGAIINPEMLTSPKFGGVVWRKKGSQPVIPHVVPFVADKIISGLEYFDNVIEKRTGVSRATAALDPETLQNQTATASQLQHDASYSQVELVARNMAELGWKRVFRQILKLVVKHQTTPRMIRLKDEPVKIDPSVWNTDMDVTVNVGMGTGSRDRDMAMLNSVLMNQLGLAEKLAAGGFISEAIDMLPKIVTTMRLIAESAGLQNAEDYYPEITDEQLAQMKEQASQRAAQGDPKVQIEKEKLQADIQRGQAEMQMDQAKTQAEMQSDREKAAADLQLQREKMAMEGQIKREQLVAEMQLKREQLIAELTLKRELSMQEMEIKREAGFYKTDTMASVKTSGVNMGGNPG
jgi:hypothetical protein